MSKRRRDPALEAFHAGCAIVSDHPLLAPLANRTYYVRADGDTRAPADEWAVVSSAGTIHCHPRRRGEPEEWAYVLAHCLLHLGMGHLSGRFAHQDSAAWNAACDLAVERFLDRLRVGRKPPEYRLGLEGLPREEQAAYEALLRTGKVPDVPRDLRYGGGYERDYQATLAAGVRHAVDFAIAQASGRVDDEGRAKPHSVVAKAHQWFINSFPLLGAIAAGFELVDDLATCRRLDIAVAAVKASDQRIYFNPIAGLDEDETRFVMAHEILHAALRHEVRCQDRDPYLWNVACDYAINQWLMDLRVGTPPTIGLLYDPQLKGLSAETIYDRIATDLRRLRRLQGFRGTGQGDMLTGPPEWWTRGDGATLDDFYRNALAQGLSYHEASVPGTLPAGLSEEIRALIQPPIPWEVELANWFDGYFAPIETRRSYHRPSRRQAATPDIPRPRTVPAADALDGRTFGVVLDTSGSMDRGLLGRALGAIASYAISRDVPAVRVVFCDAHAYDAGYLEPAAIAGRVRVRGRGGTVLQPGIDLLQDAEDFPEDGPVLVITDTELADDRLRVRRDHAYLVPAGRRLPFPPKGPVFHMR